MIVNTAWLFRKLLRVLRADAVLDVGSMNGRDALAFRAAAPAATIFAFEANPRNVRAMLEDERLQRHRILIVPSAVTNSDGQAEFHIVEPTEHATGWRGMSSLHRRPAATWLRTSTAQVATLKLNTFLATTHVSFARLALWIDVEGKAYEVIEGASDIMKNACVLHVEVETIPCIGKEQRLHSEVKALLQAHGFCEIATDVSSEREQFNALFVRTHGVSERVQVAAWLLLAWLRRAGSRLIAAAYPSLMVLRQRRLAESRREAP
jgi:FkbM family methyltransferase